MMFTSSNAFFQVLAGAEPSVELAADAGPAAVVATGLT